MDRLVDPSQLGLIIGDSNPIPESILVRPDRGRCRSGIFGICAVKLQGARIAYYLGNTDPYQKFSLHNANGIRGGLSKIPCTLRNCLEYKICNNHL